MTILDLDLGGKEAIQFKSIIRLKMAKKVLVMIHDNV